MGDTDELSREEFQYQYTEYIDKGFQPLTNDDEEQTMMRIIWMWKVNVMFIIFRYSKI